MVRMAYSLGTHDLGRTASGSRDESHFGKRQNDLQVTNISVCANTDTTNKEICPNPTPPRALCDVTDQFVTKNYIMDFVD
jgi:hypothetical protein